MLQEIKRKLVGTYIYSNTSIIFDSNPYLVVDNELLLYFKSNDNRVSATVSSISGNTAVVNFSDAQYGNSPVTVQTPHYGAGYSGVGESFSLYTSTTPSTIIQAISTGGTHSITVEGSADLNGGWISLGSLVPSVANSNTSYLSVTLPWPYARLTVVSTDANNSVKVIKAN